jgi:hypothetical protein
MTIDCWQASPELAATYAALILADENIEITVSLFFGVRGSIYNAF